MKPKIQLTPGNQGRDCLGNGLHIDALGESIECCCDECDYLMCCTNFKGKTECETCTDARCAKVKMK